MSHEELQGFHTFGSSTLTDSGTSLRIYINGPDYEAFKALVFRGLNNHPDAPVSMKQLYDILHHGKPLQDYSTQLTSSQKNTKS